MASRDVRELGPRAAADVVLDDIMHDQSKLGRARAATQRVAAERRLGEDYHLGNMVCAAVYGIPLSGRRTPDEEIARLVRELVCRPLGIDLRDSPEDFPAHGWLLGYIGDYFAEQQRTS